MYRACCALWVFVSASLMAQQTGAGLDRSPIPGDVAVGALVELLNNEAVHKELALLEEQISAVKAIRLGLIRDIRMAPLEAMREVKRGESAEVLAQEKIRQISSRAIEEIGKMLLPHQLIRLKQLDFQRRVRGFSFLLFNEPVIVRELAFSPEQRVEIPALLERLRKELAETLEREKKVAMEKVLTTLTEEQRARYGELVGEEFKHFAH